MLSHPLSTPASAPVAIAHSSAAGHPTRAEIKARAKAIKKLRKHEQRRYFFSWCSCLHALGFSF